MANNSFFFPTNWQKEQLGTKGRPFRGMSEEEVFTEVANLFRGQEDLLSEFGQFLPEAKRSLVSNRAPTLPRGTFSATAPCLSAAPEPRQDILASHRSHTGSQGGSHHRLHLHVKWESILMRASQCGQCQMARAALVGGGDQGRGPCIPPDL